MLKAFTHFSIILSIKLNLHETKLCSASLTVCYSLSRLCHVLAICPPLRALSLSLVADRIALHCQW